MKVPATISRAVLQALEKFYRNHKPASPLERLTLPLSIYSGPLTGTPAALCTLRFVMAYEAGLACKVAQRDSDHWEPVYLTRTEDGCCLEYADSTGRQKTLRTTSWLDVLGGTA